MTQIMQNPRQAHFVAEAVNQRDRDHAVLAMMKKLEKQKLKKKQLKRIDIDSHTTVWATPQRYDDIMATLAVRSRPQCRDSDHSEVAPLAEPDALPETIE